MLTWGGWEVSSQSVRSYGFRRWGICFSSLFRESLSKWHFWWALLRVVWPIPVEDSSLRIMLSKRKGQNRREIQENGARVQTPTQIHLWFFAQLLSLSRPQCAHPRKEKLFYALVRFRSTPQLDVSSVWPTTFKDTQGSINCTLTQVEYQGLIWRLEILPDISIMSYGWFFPSLRSHQLTFRN